MFTNGRQFILRQQQYRELEESMSRYFKSKPVSTLEPSSRLHFNGVQIERTGKRLDVNATLHTSKLKKIKWNSDATKEFVAQRARGAYIASHCRPDLSFGFAYASQHINPEEKHVNELNKIIERCLDTKHQCLRFIPLDLNSLSIATFIDASFANNNDFTSQLGYIICLMDAAGSANVLHYASQKCKRVTRSVLAAELYAMALGFDYAYVIQESISDILGNAIPLKVYTDSKCLFDALTTLHSTTEKRLLIDLSMLRQCYEKREIAEVLWIPGRQNPADGLTKKDPCSALRNLLLSNQILLSPNASIERPRRAKTTSTTTRTNNCKEIYCKNS